MKRRKSISQPLSSAEYKRMPKYSIGIVSKMLGVPPQTLRRYEEAGLLDPARQEGKNRLYSDENVETLTEIVELAEQGVNAVGIRYILQMRRQVLILQEEIRDARSSSKSWQDTAPQDDDSLDRH